MDANLCKNLVLFGRFSASLNIAKKTPTTSVTSSTTTTTSRTATSIGATATSGIKVLSINSHTFLD